MFACIRWLCNNTLGLRPRSHLQSLTVFPGKITENIFPELQPDCFEWTFGSHWPMENHIVLSFLDSYIQTLSRYIVFLAPNFWNVTTTMRLVEALAITITLFYIFSIFNINFIRPLLSHFCNIDGQTILYCLLCCKRRRRRNHPYAWQVPRPVNSWFQLHHADPNILQNYFRQPLRVKKDTFNMILNILGETEY